MKKFEINDWLVLNNIIYKIYDTSDLTEMRENFIEQLRLIIDFDAASFFVADKNSASLREPVGYNSDVTDGEIFENEEYIKNIFLGGKCMVYRDTDLIAEDDRQKTRLFNSVYRHNRWNYALQLVFSYDGKPLGLLTLYRTVGKDDFIYDEIFMLDMLKAHMSLRLNIAFSKNLGISNKLTIDQASSKFKLTNREKMVLSMLLQGMDNMGICDALTIRENTLKKHILNIYKKIGIKNRVQMFKLIKEEQ